MNTDFLQGRGFVGHSLTIASVFPRERKAVRDYSPEMSGGRHTFIIPEAKKGEVVTLKIGDCWELVMNDKGQIGAPQYDQKIVKVEDIAACILKEFAVNIAGTHSGRRPGIMVIAGDKPTAAEKQMMDEMQASYFDGLIEDACAMHAEHKWKSIGQPHRDAAIWRGVDASEERYRWVLNLGEAKEKKACYFCAEKILPDAKFCKECRNWQPGYEPAAKVEVKAPEPVKTEPAAAQAESPRIPPPMRPTPKQPTS